MREMFRKLPFLLIALAVLLAAEPLLHQHPIDAGATTNAVCVVCAAGVTRLPRALPTVAAPQIIAYSVVAIITCAVVTGVATLTASRAPPAL